jgi:hypothetical protein
VLVLAGVVTPVSQVISAVEAKLVVLVIERRLRLRADVSSNWSSSEWLCRALVKSDSWCSLPRRSEVRRNWSDREGIAAAK